MGVLADRCCHHEEQRVLSCLRTIAYRHPRSARSTAPAGCPPRRCAWRGSACSGPRSGSCPPAPACGWSCRSGCSSIRPYARRRSPIISLRGRRAAAAPAGSVARSPRARPRRAPPAPPPPPGLVRSPVPPAPAPRRRCPPARRLGASSDASPNLSCSSSTRRSAFFRPMPADRAERRQVAARGCCAPYAPVPARRAAPARAWGRTRWRRAAAGRCADRRPGRSRRATSRPPSPPARCKELTRPPVRGNRSATPRGTVTS